ncbi:MAG: inositol phosphorylceramide synthase [Polyangiaceae bacterium]|nr:inositol phosphorylceramide synthase [Polyangiaceae bacterium]
MRVLGHPRKLWGAYWPLPGLILASYAAAMFAIGDLRIEHVVIPLLACVMAYATPRTKRFFSDASPYLAVGIGYDLVRYARAWVLTPEQVWGCGLRELELRTFAVAPGVTLQDYFAAHNSALFDLLFAIPYAIFVYVALAYAAYLFFVDRPRMRHYLWAFAIANFISFAMWLVIPAAPPWYIREFGCAIDLSAAPSPAALARVDALLGIDYFARFYSRAASVFGAMPSMHCAYPVIGLLTAWRAASWRTRPIHMAYCALMVSAAVYLDHHWVWDALAGIAVAGVATWTAKRALAHFELSRGPALAAEPAE